MGGGLYFDAVGGMNYIRNNYIDNNKIYSNHQRCRI